MMDPISATSNSDPSAYRRESRAAEVVRAAEERRDARREAQNQAVSPTAQMIRDVSGSNAEATLTRREGAARAAVQAMAGGDGAPVDRAARGASDADRAAWAAALRISETEPEALRPLARAAPEPPPKIELAIHESRIESVSESAAKDAAETANDQRLAAEAAQNAYSAALRLQGAPIEAPPVVHSFA